MKSRSALAAILLLAVTLLALGLRLYRLDAQSLWYDEGFSVYLARMDLPAITARTAADIQPPLYYYLLHGWIGILGDGERAVRGLSVLFGVLSVPLIYSLAWLLFRSRLSSLLAALFLAVSPVHLWYGQETRMYTVLTFLCLLSSAFLLLATRTGRLGQAPVFWLGFTLTSVVALYTHYFTIFVLAFQALYLLTVWLKRGLQPWHLIMGGLASFAITALAYLPWLPHLLTRYGADVSYWPGRLKVAEVLVDSGVFLTGGESVSEQIGIYLAIGLGTLLLVCLLALFLQELRLPHRLTNKRHSAAARLQDPTANSQFPILFLMLYLIVPPALILALSYGSPKFNARYIMVSQPALLLILSGGLACLLQRAAAYSPELGHKLGNLVRWTLAGLALSFVLGASAYAIQNAYCDPAFARADFRGVADHIQEEIAPDETIILSSGHIFPVFDYYAPGLERHLLPDSPTLDTTRTLDYSIAGDLNTWLADRGGVWVVLWQDNVVDPVGYLTTMLSEAGEQQPIQEVFSGVRLQHYRLQPGTTFSDQPTINHPAEYNFGNRLRLLGYSQTGGREVTLFWQALQSLAEDYLVSLVLRDTEGQSWGQWDGRPSAYYYPTDRWRVGQIVFGRYDITPLPGTPPGDYGLEVGVYTEADPIGLDLLDQTGAPQGKRAVLGAMRLSVPVTGPGEIQVPNPAAMDLGGGLVLLGWDLDRAEAQPGDRLRLTLLWLVESQPSTDYQLGLLVTDSAGQVFEAGTLPPTNRWHPTSTWREGQAWRGQVTFHLPIQLQPGDAYLSVQLVDDNGVAPFPPKKVTVVGILATDRVFTPPQPQIALPSNFDDRIALLGADIVPEPVSPGDPGQGSRILVTLYWQGLIEMDVPYTVFVHLLGADGRIVRHDGRIVGHDGEPADGTRPTTGWVPGEFIEDPHLLVIPEQLAAGEYLVEVGLYDGGMPDLPRLPVLDLEGRVTADRILFGPVQVR